MIKIDEIYEVVNTLINNIYFTSGSFRDKSSRVPEITDSDLLEILHSCYVTYVPWKNIVA